jgi:hypothetical protein
MVSNALAGVHFVTPMITVAALFREVKRVATRCCKNATGSRGITNGRRPFRDFLSTRLFTIIATYANETVGELHDRVPVILEPPESPTWLGEGEVDPAALLRPVGEDVPNVWPVGSISVGPKRKLRLRVRPPMDSARRQLGAWPDPVCRHDWLDRQNGDRGLVACCWVRRWLHASHHHTA